MADEAQRDATEAGRVAKWDAEIMTAIMSTPQGRYWMERLLERCEMFSDVYRHDGDALGMAWRDGKGSVGRHLMAEIDRACPDSYQRMIRERRGRLEEREREERRQRTREQLVRSDIDRTPLEQMADEQVEAERARLAKTKRQER